ncbi:hypothetical protein AAG570_009128 [Ranatra chinensis]|uniref:Methyltransferase domain-containing protein n=1 Tax=Ranatra chinensis TaxID=642074 RepID=A0ABD0YSX8_9HEMI
MIRRSRGNRLMGRRISAMFTDAKLYAEASGPQQKKAYKMLLDYSHWLQWSEGERVLDIGSGPGNITEKLLLPFLADDIDCLVGVDKSEEMVRYARGACTDKRLRFYEMDITDRDQESLVADLPNQLAQGSFDKVFCFYLLHWMADKFSLALSNICHLMKPGGQGLCIQYTRIPVYDTYVVMGESEKWKPYLKGVTLEYNPLRTKKDPCEFMEKKLKEAGLVAEDISCYSSYNVYRKRADLQAIMTSIDPFLQYLPEGVHAEYMDDFLDTLLKRAVKTDDGYICIPFTIMTCAFSKPTSEFVGPNRFWQIAIVNSAVWVVFRVTRADHGLTGTWTSFRKLEARPPVAEGENGLANTARDVLVSGPSNGGWVTKIPPYKQQLRPSLISLYYLIVPIWHPFVDPSIVAEDQSLTEAPDGRLHPKLCPAPLVGAEMLNTARGLPSVLIVEKGSSLGTPGCGLLLSAADGASRTVLFLWTSPNLRKILGPVVRPCGGEGVVTAKIIPDPPSSVASPQQSNFPTSAEVVCSAYTPIRSVVELLTLHCESASEIYSQLVETYGYPRSEYRKQRHCHQCLSVYVGSKGGRSVEEKIQGSWKWELLPYVLDHESEDTRGIGGGGRVSTPCSRRKTINVPDRGTKGRSRGFGAIRVEKWNGFEKCQPLRSPTTFEELPPAGY